jgi:hypothetical protein
VVERVSVRAFDKAVRRKPLAFAADAVGLWEIACGGRRNSEGGGVVRESNDMVVVRCCGVVVLIMRRVELRMFG